MRHRSFYPKPFKAQVVQECLQPGETLSSIAISQGINANVIRKWLPLYRDHPSAAFTAFVPLRAAPKRQTEALAIIELPLGEQSITLKWPVSDLKAAPALSVDLHNDSHRPHLACHRAHGHACRHRDRDSPGHCRVRCCEAALRLSVRQSPR